MFPYFHKLDYILIVVLTTIFKEWMGNFDLGTFVISWAIGFNSLYTMLLELQASVSVICEM